MRLFLVATIPLILSVPVQMSIGINKIKVIALAALAGSIVNLPISCILTARLGVEGVIWGTVLTTLFSNLLIPGVYVFDVLEIDLRTFLKRTLSAPMAGAAVLLVTATMLNLVVPPASVDSSLTARALHLMFQLSLGSLAYLGGYVLVPTGRRDLIELTSKLRRR
jgi:O-antigen/teichoic acid export membrane protein